MHLFCAPAEADHRLSLRRFTLAGFDLATKVRQQPTRDGLRAIWRVRREFGFVFEMNDDGARHHTVGAGVVHAVQFHA